MNNNVLHMLTAAAVLSILGGCAHYADYVDTNVGVLDKGASNCVVGPMLPYGSINPSPQTEKGRSDGYNPLFPIRGFGQMHVSGTGWPTYGNFLISPETGPLVTALHGHDSEHSGEVTKAYYFSTSLDRYGIKAEVTPAHYSAIYRFTFPAADEAHLIFDAVHSIPQDLFLKAKKRLFAAESSIDPEQGLVKMMIRMKGGWATEPYTLYFVGKFDKAPAQCGSWRASADSLSTFDETFPGQLEITAGTDSTVHVGSYCTFPTREGEEVLLKVAVSFTGYDKAMEHLDSEIPGWDFEGVEASARKAWDKKLSSIKIDALSEDDRTIFYSALYRFYTFAHERTLDRQDTSVPYWDDNYAFWDTFRTVFPMLILVDEDAYRGNVEAIMDRFEKRGGVWDSFVAGTDRKRDQGGNDVDCLLADGYVKGVSGIDWERVYTLVKHNADSMRIGVRQTSPNRYKYKELGWIPACLMSSSQTLEFCYNDFCAAQMARGLGHNEDADKYMKRSGGWVNLWNPDLENRGYKGFIDARKEDGTFLNIDPEKFGGSWMSPFYEGKTWTYSYYVPHDMPKVIELMGGNEKFVERLVYGYENKLTEYDNEPGFLTLRALTDAGRPDLSSVWAHKLMKKFTLKKYPDNEDTGSMGSWYAFTAIGLFPDAGQDFYYLNAPKYRKVTVRLSNGRKLRIEAPEASEDNVVIKSCTFRGKEVSGAVIKHSDIMRGGVIRMELCPPAGE